MDTKISIDLYQNIKIARLKFWGFIAVAKWPLLALAIMLVLQSQVVLFSLGFHLMPIKLTSFLSMSFLVSFVTILWLKVVLFRIGWQFFEQGTIGPSGAFMGNIRSLLKLLFLCFVGLLGFAICSEIILLVGDLSHDLSLLLIGVTMFFSLSIVLLGIFLPRFSLYVFGHIVVGHHHLKDVMKLFRPAWRAFRFNWNLAYIFWLLVIASCFVEYTSFAYWLRWMVVFGMTWSATANPLLSYLGSVIQVLICFAWHGLLTLLFVLIYRQLAGHDGVEPMIKAGSST